MSISKLNISKYFKRNSGKAINNKQIANKQYKELIINNSADQYNTLFCALIISILCIYVFLPEGALAAAAKTTLEGQLDRISVLSSGKLKTIGISVATILVSIWAVVKGNIRRAGAIVAIGVILGFYLQWIADGMQVGGSL